MIITIVLWSISILIAYFSVGFIAAHIDLPRLVRVCITDNMNSDDLFREDGKMCAAQARVWRHQYKTVLWWPLYLPRNALKGKVAAKCAAANHVERAYHLEQMEIRMEEQRQKELQNESH